VPCDVNQGSNLTASWGFRMTYAPGNRRAVIRTKPDLTIHFLDICALDVTKRTEAELAVHPRKAAIAARLRELDVPTNRFSCLLALMEKASDTRSARTDEDLQAQIVGDLGHMREFFGEAKVVEPDEYLLDYISQVRKIPVELARPTYLAFLRGANESCFGLYQPVAKAKRLKTASALVNLADGLEISRQHPILAVTIACLYGNASAREVLKFTPTPGAFPAENVLADVMTISRFLGRKLELEADYRRGLTSIRHVSYITDDNGLAEILSCYQGEALSTRDGCGHQEVLTKGRVDFARLLTEISHQPGPRLDPADPASAGPSEYDRVCALVFG
jgi:hypothetical protein